MRFKVIACEILFREISYFAALSPHIIDIVFLSQKLHEDPKKLRTELQKTINETENSQIDYDAILLGYALCSNGTAGLKSHKYSLVIPRAHDCITILLGCKEKYRQYFDSHEGIYWYSAGWIERTLEPGKEWFENTLKEYTKKYGEENARYLMEIEQGWLKKYRYATYIRWDRLHKEYYRKYTQECAKYLGWKYDELKGDTKLVEDLLNGTWDEERFLIIPAGYTISPTYDHRIIKAEKTKLKAKNKR